MQTHGVQIRIDLSKFVLGSSFFVPGVDPRILRQEITEEMRAHRIKVDIRFAIENDVLGVRVWRIG